MFELKVGRQKGPNYYELLAHTYVFGEKIQDDSFCKAVMPRILEQCDEANERDEH